MEDDDKENLNAHKELDKRLNDVEIDQASIISDIKSINNSILNMNSMFQKFISDSGEVAKMSAKIDAIDRLDREVRAIGTKYDDTYRKLILLEQSHVSCNSEKATDRQSMKNIEKKVDSIELSLKIMNSEVAELAVSKKGIEDKAWEVLKALIIVIVFYIILVVVGHINVNNNLIGSPPGFKEDLSKSTNTFFMANSAHAEDITFKGNTSCLVQSKTNSTK